MPIEQVFSYPSGTVAKGPVPALRVYSSALQSLGITMTILDERSPCHWDDDSGSIATAGNVLVLMFGEEPTEGSDAPFVIAQSFSATRLADNRPA